MSLLARVKFEDPREPFIPPFLIRNQPPKCRSYAEDLGDTDYSESLQDLIHECLYEVPRNRPSLAVLKQDIAQGIETALAAAHNQYESLDRFKHHEPDTLTPAIPPRKRRRQRPNFVEDIDYNPDDPDDGDGPLQGPQHG